MKKTGQKEKERRKEQARGIRKKKNEQRFTVVRKRDKGSEGRGNVRQRERKENRGRDETVTSRQNVTYTEEDK